MRSAAGGCLLAGRMDGECVPRRGAVEIFISSIAIENTSAVAFLTSDSSVPVFLEGGGVIVSLLKKIPASGVMVEVKKGRRFIWGLLWRSEQPAVKVIEAGAATIG